MPTVWSSPTVTCAASHAAEPKARTWRCGMRRIPGGECAIESARELPSRACGASRTGPGSPPPTSPWATGCRSLTRWWRICSNLAHRWRVGRSGWQSRRERNRRTWRPQDGRCSPQSLWRGGRTCSWACPRSMGTGPSHGELECVRRSPMPLLVGSGRLSSRRLRRMPTFSWKTKTYNDECSELRESLYNVVVF